MERVLIKDLKEHLGKEVKIKGWVGEIRNLSKIKFIILRDLSGDMQTVAFKGETEEESFEEINKVVQESVIEIVGVPKEEKQSKWGLEVAVKKIKILSLAETPLPIDNSDKSNTQIDKRLDYRFLDVRNLNKQAIFRIRSEMVSILYTFFNQNLFTNIQTPKLTALGVESGAELFNLNYFGKPIYLAQSPQIYKQMFMNGGFERVFEIGPVFRAEQSHTTRHLTEFTGVDFEMAFIEDENDLMDMVENMYKFIITELNNRCKPELERLNITLTVPEKIPRIPYSEAIEMVNKDVLDSEAEKLIAEKVKIDYNSDYVFITEFPWEERPFYHMKKSDNITRSFDLLYNGVEVCTGAQREHRIIILREQAQEKEVELAKGYEEIFLYGVPAHGGVGLGLDRMVEKLLNFDNVREAVLLPRDPERRTP
jgi:nondiscriminating aspartyl-tRNA synthetase